MTKTIQIGAAVGSGVVARAAEAGGADFLLAINAGRMRNMGLPSIACMLPIRDANAATLPFAMEEVLPQAQIPVYVGLSVWSQSEDLNVLISQILDAGFAGVVNFPNAMLFSADFHHFLDRAGVGTPAEIGLLKQVEAAGGQSLFYCGSLAEARAAAIAGLSALVFNFGWNVGGAQTHTVRVSLEEVALKSREVVRVVRRIHPGMKIYLEGGPILTAEDLNFVISQARIDGYVGGSTIDRFPVQSSVGNQIAEYKSASQNVQAHSVAHDRILSSAAQVGLVGSSPTLTDFVIACERTRLDSGGIELLAPPGADLTSAIQFLTQMSPEQIARASHTFSKESSAQQDNAILFGAERAGQNRLGLLESGHPYLILYNCQCMPKLLRKKFSLALKIGRFQRLGTTRSLPLQTRLIFVSNEKAGPCWPDSMLTTLIYPSLKTRHLDIRALIDYLLRQSASAENWPNISPTAYRVLAGHIWPQNEMELKSVVRQLIQWGPGKSIEAIDIHAMIHESERASNLKSATDTERDHILQSLTRNNFRKGATASALGISRKTLYNRMKRLGLTHST